MRMRSPKNEFFHPRERERRHRGSHPDIHPDHPHLTARRVLARRLPALRENRRRIPEGRPIYQSSSVFTRTTDSTGPKISSFAIVISAVTLSKIVGPRKKPPSAVFVARPSTSDLPSRPA